jgi:hypothetical protein
MALLGKKGNDTNSTNFHKFKTIAPQIRVNSCNSCLFFSVYSVFIYVHPWLPFSFRIECSSACAEKHLFFLWLQ